MRHKLFQALSLSLLGLGLTVAAHANPLPITAGTYNLTNTTVSDGTTTFTLTGTVTLGSNGLITTADVTLNDAALSNPVFNTVTSPPGSGGNNPVADFAYLTPSNNSGQLYLSYLQTFDNSGNIQLCIASAGDCNSYQASYSHLYFQSSFGYNSVDLGSGSLDPASSAALAPEPSSLALLGTGIFGIAGLIRRRFTQA